LSDQAYTTSETWPQARETVTGTAEGNGCRSIRRRPAATDVVLWPDELPFTAFGQFGANFLDLRVFDQDIWWVDRDGVFLTGSAR
jgi:hypothetical protein